MKIDKSDYYPYVGGNPNDNDVDPVDIMDSKTVDDSSSSATDENRAGDLSGDVPAKETYTRPEKFDEDPGIGESFISRCCNIISWILVPMLVSVYATIMIFGLSELHVASTGTKTIFTLIVFGFNALLPMILVFILKALGIVQDIGLNGRQERLIPYIIMIISYMGTAYFFFYKGAPSWMCLFYAGGALAAFINMIVNFWWKISAHAAAVAGVVAMLLIINKVGHPYHDLTWWMVGSVLACGLLGSARIWLGRHTLGQVLAGYASGFLSVYLLSIL